MERSLMNAIFDTYNKGDYPKEIREIIDTIVDEYAKATGKDHVLTDDQIMNLVSAVHFWGFRQGFFAHSELINECLMMK